MTVEKINGVQPSPVMKKPETKQPEKPTEQKTSKNSKHVIAALSALAVISAAGIAIYKHKNTKKISEETNTAIDEVKNKIKVEDFFGKEAKEGLKLIEKAEQEARRAKIKSHVANEAWKKEQHRLKEQAYQELFDKHFEAIEKEVKPVVEETVPAAEKAVVKAAEEALPVEYRGLSEVERLIIERDAITAQKYGKDHSNARLAEIDTLLEKLGMKNNPIEYTPEIKTRVEIAKANIEKDYWQSLVQKSLNKKENIIKTMEEKGIKPLELSEEEEKLQYQYATKSKQAEYQLKKGDMEWYQKFSESARKVLQTLKEKNIEPLNFESADMQLQYELLDTKNSICGYRAYADEMAEKAEELIEKLKEIIES